MLPPAPLGHWAAPQQVASPVLLSLKGNSRKCLRGQEEKAYREEAESVCEHV